MTLEIIGQFVVYVLAFWGMWKIFDKIFHTFFPSIDHRQDQEIKDIKKIIGAPKSLSSTDSSAQYHRGGHTSGNYDQIRQELRTVKAEKERWRKKALSIIALQKLNVASPKQIESIYGCGPKTAQKIIGRRPFNKVEDVVRVIPGCHVDSILRWAERFV